MAWTQTDSDIINRTAQASFMRELTAPPPVDFAPFVTEMKTDSGVVDIGHYGALPYPVEWGQGRQIPDLKAFSHRIVTETWQHNLGIELKTLMRDKTGTLARRMAGMGSKAQEWYGAKYTQLLEQGNTTVYGHCYDGKALYATDHGDGDTDQANLLSRNIVDPVNPTISEYAASFVAARATLRTLKDEHGNPQAFPRGLVAMVPQGMEGVATQVLNRNGTMGGDAVSNLGTRADSAMATGNERGQASVVVNPWMETDDRWLLLAVGGIGDVGPLARVLERDFEISTFDPYNSSEHKKNLKVEVIGDAEMGFGYALWQRSAMVLFT